MDNLTSLVEQLKKFKPFGLEPKPLALSFVINYRQFVEVLERISRRVGWHDAKKEIASKVRSMIVNYRRYGRPLENELLHTLITGDPGVGKTMFGGDLAELWAASGCLKLRESSVTQINPLGIETQQKLLIKENQMKSLQEIHQQNRLLAAETITSLNQLRRRIRGQGSRFQKIKDNLRMISASGGIQPLNVKILPLIVPLNSCPTGIEFGSVPLPKFLLPVFPIEEEPKVQFKFGIFTRGDFVGKYQGHSSERVRTLFNKYEGGVIMIDEAYDLVTSENDDFGREVLTEIINYMTRYPEKIIFIFSGYKKQMEKTILALQPGLVRRFKWRFDIDSYTSEEICQLLDRHLEILHLTLSPVEKEEINTLIRENVRNGYFKYFGGDTERLSGYIRDTMQEKLFLHALDDNLAKDDYLNLFQDISLKLVEEAIKKYIKNYNKDTESKPPEGMYI